MSPTLDLSSLNVILSHAVTIELPKSIDRSVPATFCTSLKLFMMDVANKVDESNSV